MRVVDFGEHSTGEWLVINDSVMGGRSSGALNPAGHGVAVFEGTVSLENNGGFTTARTDIADGALAGADRMRLRVRGDGKRYHLRLRPDRGPDSVAYAASFRAPTEWSTVELPLDRFEPTFRGRRPPGAAPLDPSRIRQVGIMIKDGQEGRFHLEIEWIDAASGPRDAGTSGTRP